MPRGRAEQTREAWRFSAPFFFFDEVEGPHAE